MKIKERIRAAYKPRIEFYALMGKVYPPAQFPRAWRYPTRGGPPGGAMALSRALNQMGAEYDYDAGTPTRYVFLPGSP